MDKNELAKFLDSSLTHSEPIQNTNTLTRT